MTLRTILLATAASACALPALADVNIYTTRQPELIQPVMDAFTADTGIAVNLAFVNDALIDDSIEAEFAWLQQVIVNIRTVRSEMTIPPSKDINAIFHKTNKNEESWLASSESYLKKLAKLESITVTNGQADIPQSATTLVGSMEIHIPMAGLIDVEAESARLQKEIDKIQKNISQFEGKLNNENYVKKAPAPVVEQERVRLQDALTARGKLEEQLVSIKQMS